MISVSSTFSEQSVFINDSSNNDSIESKVSNGPNNDIHSENKTSTHWSSNGLIVDFCNIDSLTSKFHETEKADVYTFCEIRPKWTKTPLGDVQTQIPFYTLVTIGGRFTKIFLLW